MMDIKNQTKQDAHDRISLSKMESLAHNPSEEYLLNLLRNIYLFKDEVELAIWKMNDKHNRKKQRCKFNSCEHEGDHHEE